jgi:hypothetical protein
MPFQFFFIPALDSAAATDELNHFLRLHRVLHIDHKIIFKYGIRARSIHKSGDFFPLRPVPKKWVFRYQRKKNGGPPVHPHRENSIPQTSQT